MAYEPLPEGPKNQMWLQGSEHMWAWIDCSKTRSRESAFSFSVGTGRILGQVREAWVGAESQVPFSIWNWGERETAKKVHLTHRARFHSRGKVPNVAVLVTKSCPTLMTPRTVVHQALLSMGFPRQEY